MKKINYLFIAIISFISINFVYADTYSVTLTSDNLDFYEENSSYISTLYDYLYDYYSSNFQDNMPYYAVTLSRNGNMLSMRLDCINVPLALTYGPHPTNPSSYSSIGYWTRNALTGEVIGDYVVSQRPNIVSSTISKSVDVSSGSFYTTSVNSESWSRGYYGGEINFYNNFDYFYFPADSSDILTISYNNHTYSYSNNDILPSLSDFWNFHPFNDPNNLDSKYVEINLNNYSYVALSLKNYTLRNDDINQFYTNIYVKGQLCSTRVNNYGMSDAYNPSINDKAQACTTVYNDFTPVRYFILKHELEEHSIWYLKAYDTSIDNIVKIDSEIFNVSYITSDNKDNPIININGKNYSTIPYDELSSTATQSFEEGYVSGQVCGLGDLNCYSNVTGSDFSDIFESPLKVLKSVWSSISSVFTLISEFISFLPVELRSFLYLAFMLAVVLGILKIIL